VSGLLYCLKPVVVSSGYLSDLSKSAMIAILSHKLLKASEVELWQSMLNWAHIDGVATDKQKSLITPLLTHIRFSDMTCADLTAHVEPTQILSSETMCALLGDMACKVPQTKQTRLEKVSRLT
jgi:hypothetical protein